MNLEFFGTKSGKLILFGIPILFVILIVVLIIANNNSKTNRKLLLKCSDTKNLDESASVEQYIELNEISDERELLQRIIAKYDLNNDVFTSETINQVIINSVEKKLEKLSDRSYIDSDYETSVGYIKYDFIYHINKGSWETAYNDLKFDFFNSSIDEIKDYYEKSGLSCQKY